MSTRKGVILGVRFLGGGIFPLLIVFAAARASAAAPEDRQIRIITIKIAADQYLATGIAWKKDIKKLIGNSSEVFKEKFGIEFRITAWESWQPEKDLDSFQAFLDDLKRKVPPGEADIVVGLIAPFYADDTPAGIADYFNGCVLLKLANPWAMAPVILHELGHVFGAVDLEENGSVMDPRNPGFEFDAFSARIITLNRDRSFHTGSFPFPPGLTDDVIAAYQARGLLGRCEPELHLFLAYLYIESGDYASASKECVEILKNSPESADVQVLLANMKLALGEVDSAITMYEKILTRQPNLLTVHFNLGVAWLKRGNQEEAASAFKEAIRLKPDHAEAHASLGCIYLKRGDVETAMRHCRTALKIFPDFAEGLCILSLALILKEDKESLEEAVGLGRKAVAIKPQLFEAHAILGIAYGCLGRYSEGEGELMKALELRPDSLEAHLSLATYFKKTGQNDRAAVHLAKIAEIDPDFMTRYKDQSAIDIAKLRRAALLERLR
jgi:tetratricopeptide (TPR) repeat protein